MNFDNYVKPKYGKNAKLCHTDSFIVHVKTDDIYKDIAKNVENDLTLQTMKQTVASRKK